MLLTRVKVQGFEDALQNYRKAPIVVSQELNTAMHKSVLTLKAEAKIQAPVGANNVLRSAIYSRVSGGGYGLIGEVGVGPAAAYAAAVHDGSKPHMPPVMALKQWAERKLGSAALAWPVAIHIKKFGTKANPFMDRAWDSQQSKINAFFEAAQQKIVERLGS